MDACLIIDPPRSGAWNMGVDESLRERSAREGMPIVRFYQWSPATLSLGYFQPIGQRSLHAASLALPVVRRSSGGGAIIHDVELTYSCAMPLNDSAQRVAANLTGIFHAALVESLREWRIAAELCRRPAAVAKTAEPFLCFQRRSEGDVLVSDGKIAGSAQRKLRGSLLQHGSVLLRQSAFAPELPGVAELTGSCPTAAELRQCWTERLSRAIGWTFQATSLGSAEELRAAAWAADRFDADRWTSKR